MDDPWGSPWAATENRTIGAYPGLSVDFPSTSVAPALAGPSDHTVPATLSQSLWADDEEDFGDWASGVATAVQLEPEWGLWDSATKGAQTAHGSISGDVVGIASSPDSRPQTSGHSMTLEPSPRLIPTEPKISDGAAIKVEAAAIERSKTSLDFGRRSSVSEAGGPSENADGRSSGQTSRRDSRASEKSRHSHERPDSPITSIEEDLKAYPLPPHRKVSRTVQDLVDMYDGLVKTAVDPRLLPSVHAGDARLETGGVDSHKKAEGDSAANDNAASSVRTFKDPPLFVVPLDRLDGLWDVPQPSAGSRISEDVREGDPARVPDELFSHDFNNIHERKAWYRVSRQGSSRRHTAGDDDSYRRVVWPNSAIRADVLKIVRGWMEDDSITGRPARGGGGGKASMFGWDSKAEPITLADVLGGNHGAHSRSVSLRQESHTRALSSSGFDSTTQRPSSMVVGGSSTNFGYGLLAEPAEKTLTPTPPPSSVTPVVALEVVNSDDDEWGEMVITPSDANTAIVIADVPTGSRYDSPIHLGIVPTLAARDVSDGNGARITRLRSGTDDADDINKIVGGLPDLSYMRR